MKKISFLAFISIAYVARAAVSTPVSTQYQHIANTWIAPNSTYPDCSASVILNCLNTYTYTATDPNGHLSLVTVPNGSVPAGGLVSYTWGPGGYLYCGTWTLSVVVNFIDGSGAAAISSPDTVTTAVSCPLVASPATGLTSNPAP